MGSRWPYARTEEPKSKQHKTDASQSAGGGGGDAQAQTQKSGKGSKGKGSRGANKELTHKLKEMKRLEMLEMLVKKVAVLACVHDLEIRGLCGLGYRALHRPRDAFGPCGDQGSLHPLPQIHKHDEGQGGGGGQRL